MNKKTWSAIILALGLIWGGTRNEGRTDDSSDGKGDSSLTAMVPQLGCWFWMDPAYFDPETLGEEARKNFLQAVNAGGIFDLLSTSTRYDIEITDPLLHDLMKDAAAVARNRFGVGLLLDLDIRMARRAFEKEFPNCHQESLRFAETMVSPAVVGDGGEDSVTLDFTADPLSDHYTGNSVPYLVRGSRLVRVWSYQKDEGGLILPETIRDVTDRAFSESDSPERLRVTVSLGGDSVLAKPSTVGETFVSAAVAFAFLYPDVFSPELIRFEKKILRQFADIPLAGTCKDEWGFPPCFDSIGDEKEFWFSSTMADAYAKKTDRDLVDDLFLFREPRCGMEETRTDQLDDYHRLCRDRHIEIETEYVRTSKEIFGPNSFTATHPTWWPWPDAREFRKNGLSWWGVPRDFAQTDECVPYPCRNGLAKKTGTVWVNMFYSPTTEPYIDEHWGAVLSGGRVNIHPIYPAGKGVDGKEESTPATPMTTILDTGLDQARRRIHLVDFLSNAPVDSPVAVVFGHFGTMNSARPEWNRVGTIGVALCDELARRGFPTDLIPSSESENWRCDEIGRLRYGIQSYETVIFFGENPSDADDFDLLRGTGGVGEKSHGNGHLDGTANEGVDLNGSGTDNKAADEVADKTANGVTDVIIGQSASRPATRIETIPATVSDEEITALADRVANDLTVANVSPVTGWTERKFWNDYVNVLPPRSGFGRMVDGTRIWTRAENSPAGDRFVLENETVRLDRETVHVHHESAPSGQNAVKIENNKTATISATATGLLACQFDVNGNLTALAAGGLESFSGGGIDWPSERLDAVARLQETKKSEINAFIIPQAADVVLRRISDERWQGIVLTGRGEEIPIPDSLLPE